MGGEAGFSRDGTFDAMPPNMAQLDRHEVISAYSSAGMAGHGAYSYAPDGQLINGPSSGGIQERSNYVYGQNYEEDNASDHAHGIYSSQPQAQAAYNPEAYGSYAYSTEDQHAAVGPGAYTNYQNESHHDVGFAPLHSPYDNATAPAPALVAGAPAVAAGRGAANTRPVYDDADDAYGGI